MLTPPAGLTESALASTLAESWGVTVDTMTYRAVGFGSHHWEVVDGAGARWFVTVDDLATSRHSARERPDTGFGRLRAALATATRLHDHGHRFVVAPVAGRDGEPVVRLTHGLAAALYPFVDGQAFEWGEFTGPAHRHAILDLVIAVHTAPACVYEPTGVDDFWIPHRDELEAGLDPPAGVADGGPYTRPTAALLAEHGPAIRRLLARYDALVAAGRDRTLPVLTHGEPHRGNTMLTADGWRLIDWDTALVAPPERDLWWLDPGDGSAFRTYADATGTQPSPSMVALYRLRWDIADLAVSAAGLLRPHPGDANDRMSWKVLAALVDKVAG